MSSRSPRSLADHVRGWSRDQLAELLRARPDLAMPAPSDSSALAARATSRASIARAYELCDAADRAAITAIASLDGLTIKDLAPLVGATAAQTKQVVTRLSDLLLVWDDGSGLRVPRPLAERTAIALGPPASAIPGLLGELDERATSLLRHLIDGQLEGVSAMGPTSPATTLVALGLLGARTTIEPGTTGQRRLTVTLSVRQHFLDGRITNQPVTAPAIATTEVNQHQVDQIGAGSASVTLRHIEAIAEVWASRPPVALKSGGLGVRDFRALTKSLQLDAHAVAFLLETMHAAGLIGTGEIDGTDEFYDAWMPTLAFDEWLRLSAGARWAHLAHAWLAMPRKPAGVGTRGTSGAINALSTEASHPHIASLRRFVLSAWATLPPGSRLASGTGVASLFTAVHWKHPQWYHFDELALGILEEAAWLGLVAHDGLSTPARALINGDDPAAALGPLLPTPVDHILIQADLTAIAPGPLTIDLAIALGTLADIDSRGGATVYRFTSDSVRRGLDTGRTAAEILEFLTAASKTPVPQALEYLVTDVARRFGALRLGSAQVFLRSDDEVAIAELLHDARVSSLHLRQIAPTVLISDLDPTTVLAKLREIGAAPVLEAADGSVRVAAPVAHRAPGSRLAKSSPAGLVDARITATVAAIQSGDRAATARPATEVVHATHDIITMLRHALEASGEVVLAYAGADGTVTQRVVRPLRLEGGRLTAFDERSDLQREFVVHRITAAAPAD